MSIDPTSPAETPIRQELRGLREHWLLLLILGAVVTVIGTFAVIASFIATLATVEIFGTLLFIGGVLQLVNAITCRNWRGFFVYLLSGVLATIVGLIMMNHPLAAAAGITLMIAAAFMVAGILRIVVAAIEHMHGWPWLMVSGFISLFLGVFIWKHFPASAFNVIGIFIGIDLIFAGWSWIWLALGIRSAFPAKS